MMVNTSAVPGAPAASSAASGVAAEDGAATVSGFAALLAGASGAAPVEADTAADAAATASDTKTGDDASVEDGSPPLLGWLFGLMAAKDAPAGDAAVVASAGEGDESAVEDGLPSLPGGLLTAVATRDAPPAGQKAAEAAMTSAAAGMPPGRDTRADPRAAAAADPLAAADTVSTPGPGDAETALRTAPGEGLPEAALAARAAPIDSPPAAAPARAVAAERSLIATSPDFADELGERISWQIQEGVSEAQIELHPAELGRLVVNIEMRGDEAQVRILASEGATRALLAQALPQLRELLGGAGLNLTRAQIGESGSRREERDAVRGTQQESQSGLRRRVARVLLVDAYA